MCMVCTKLAGSISADKEEYTALDSQDKLCRRRRMSTQVFLRIFLQG